MSPQTAGWVQVADGLGHLALQVSWSNSLTFACYITKILVPYCDHTRERLGLLANQKARVVLDVFRAHRTPELLDYFTASGFVLDFVPANCTSELQPLDLTVNRVVKEELRTSFVDWYAGKITEAMEKSGHDVDLSSLVQPDFRLSVIKPIHAKWVVKALSDVGAKRELIKSGWRKAGIGVPSSAVSAPHVPPPVLPLGLLSNFKSSKEVDISNCGSTEDNRSTNPVPAPTNGSGDVFAGSCFWCSNKVQE